jgi:hypothetical protein
MVTSGHLTTHIVFGRYAQQRSGLVRTNRPSPPLDMATTA